MAYSNQTTHYGLPLPTGSDKSTWTDTNNAFNTIDQAIYEASQAGSGQAAAIAQLQSQMTTANANISENASDIAEEVATRTAQDAAHTTEIGAINTKLGSNDITGHSDGTVTGVLLGLITELNSIRNLLDTDEETATAQTVTNLNINALDIVGNGFGVQIGTRTMFTATAAATISTSSSYDYVADMWRLTAAQVQALFKGQCTPEHSYRICRALVYNTNNEFVNTVDLYMWVRTSGVAHIGVRATSGSQSFPNGYKYYALDSFQLFNSVILPDAE